MKQAKNRKEMKSSFRIERTADGRNLMSVEGKLAKDLLRVKKLLDAKTGRDCTMDEVISELLDLMIARLNGGGNESVH